MNRPFNKWLYSLLFLLFLFSFFNMLYYGKKTFHVESKTVDTKKYQYHFVLIPEEVDNDYWRLVEKGARSAALKNDVYLEYLGPKQANNDEHLRTIDQAIASQVDGIMTQGVTDPAFIPLINKAVQKGIPVVTVDTDAPDSDRNVYVGTNNYYAGFLAGQAFIQDTKGEQYVGIVTGRLHASHQKLRVQGFKDAIKHDKRIHIVDIKESNITKTGAVQATYDLIKEHPHITAFYGTSALDGLGIVEVVENRKQDYYIIAFDTLPATLKYINKGKIDATVVQYPIRMGENAIEALIKLINGEKVDPLQFTETKIFRKEDFLNLNTKLEGAWR